MPEPRGARGATAPPPSFADQLTLFEPERANYPHLLLLPPPPMFFTFRHHWFKIIKKYVPKIYHHPAWSVFGKNYIPCNFKKWNFGSVPINYTKVLDLTYNLDRRSWAFWFAKTFILNLKSLTSTLIIWLYLFKSNPTNIARFLKTIQCLFWLEDNFSMHFLFCCADNHQIWLTC